MSMSNAKAFIFSAVVIVGIAMFAPTQAADDVKNLNATAKTFMDTCLKTAPDFAGVEAALAAKGFQQRDDGTWSNSGTNANKQLKISGGNVGCTVWRQGIDAKETAERVVLVMAKARYADIKPSAKGRRTTINFSLNDRDMVVIVEPYKRKFTAISVLKAAQ